MSWFSSTPCTDPVELANTQVHLSGTSGYRASDYLRKFTGRGVYRAKPKVSTILCRLGHLLFKTTDPNFETMTILKWYLRELPNVPLSQADRALTIPMVKRLQTALNDFETRWGLVDDTHIDKMLEFSGHENALILHGPTFGYWAARHGAYDPYSPMEKLSQFIDQYGWSQS